MKKAESRRNLYWIAAIAALLSFYMLYKRALFNGGMPHFDQPIYMSVLLASIGFIAVAIAVRKAFKELNGMLVLLAVLIPLSFYISYFFAASDYMAVNGILTSLFHFILFVSGLIVAKQPKAIQTAGNIVLISGFAVVLFGLMNWFGNASFWGLFQWTDSTGQLRPVYTDAVWMAADGPRLASVFQYSNTYAGYLIALLLASIASLTFARGKVMRTLTSFMIVPVLLSFFLTLSRGGLVFLPVVFVFLLFFLKPAKQWLFILYTVLALVLSLGILGPVTNLGRELQTNFNSLDYLIGCLLVIAASAVYAGLYWVINKYAMGWMDRVTTRYQAMKFSFVYLPIAMILVGTVSFYLLTSTGLSKIFPDNIRTRIESINLGTQTVQERGAFYTDALKIFVDYPIFGAGGGAWKALYPQYQSYPYISTQAHNFLIQHLVETGIVGTLVLLLVIGIILFAYIRSYYQDRKKNQDPDVNILLFFIIMISLLAHSLIDFDMTFVYISGLVFFALGIVGSRVDFSLKPAVSIKYSTWLIAILTIIAFVLSGLLSIAHGNYKKTLSMIQKNQPFQAIIRPLDQAISISKNPHYLAFRLDIYRQVYSSTQNPEFLQQALETIKDIKKHEPYDRLGYLRSVAFYQNNNMFDEAVLLADEAVAKFPWSIDMYEQAISLHAQIGNQEQNRESWDVALKLYDEVLGKVRLLSEQSVDLLQSQSFTVTKPMAATIGQIYFLQGKYQEAVNVMQPYVNMQSFAEEDRVLMRFYFASLIKLNQNDEELLNRFITAFPDEKSLIDSLLAD